MAGEEDAVARGGAEAEPNGSSSLLVGVPTPAQSVDRQLQAILQGYQFHQFDQWKFPKEDRHKPATSRLRATLVQLLHTASSSIAVEFCGVLYLLALIGARDYGGAAKVLAVMYHRFAVTPALCVQASLEILRRQPEYRNDLLHFYQTALENRHLDKTMLLKELWLFHVIHGEFYEAYHLYQDEIQRLGIDQDARLFANFGMLCYWLLFIESSEIREKLKREDVNEEEDEAMDEMGTNGVDGLFQSGESVESVIEAKYMFKPPIGVHILYEQASTALRRAVALSPNSAMFVEHYVQLLVLVGDIQAACDYLEGFFHANPDDPHGARLLAGFLENYYPDSVDAQVDVYVRWMTNDPSCGYPLEKLIDLSSAGVVPPFVLSKVLVEALDTCGSDTHVVQNPQVTLALWRNLAELLSTIDEEEFSLSQGEMNGDKQSSYQKTLTDMGAQRLWWKRLYFSRPATKEEVVAAASRHDALLEVYIFRAAVANRLFPERLPITTALQSTMAPPHGAINRSHLRLFKSLFPGPLDTSDMEVTHKPFSEMPFIRASASDWPRRSALPTFQGGSHTGLVLNRQAIVKATPRTGKTTLEVTKNGEFKGVDEQLAAELEAALEEEVAQGETANRVPHHMLKTETTVEAEEQRRTRAVVPAYVAMVEEEGYSDQNATPKHVYTAICQKLRRSNMAIPTAAEVISLLDFFQKRWMENAFVHGHRGLLVRYETFIARYVHQLRAKGVFKITVDIAKDAMREMKSSVASSDSHFPELQHIQRVMRIKMVTFNRLRRRCLLDLRKTVRGAIRTVPYVSAADLAAAVWVVCKHNGMEGIISEEDVVRTVPMVLPRHYLRVVESIALTTRKQLTDVTVRGDSLDPYTVYSRITRSSQGPIATTLDHIKAYLWFEHYEALYGRINGDDDTDDEL